MGNLAFNVDGVGFPVAFADSSQESFPPSLINDGQQGTFWVSEGTEPGEGPTPENPTHVGVDLGESHPVGEVTKVPRTQGSTVWGPRAYTVEVSTDGQTWTGVAAESETEPAPTAPATSEFEAIEARYVRLRVTEAWGGFTDPAPNVQLAELEVRGAPVLALSAKPRKRKARAGGKARFKAILANSGNAAASGIEVCAKVPKRLAKVKGRRCAAAEGLDPGAKLRSRLKLEPTRRARGKRVTVRFKATAAEAAPAKARAVLKVKR